MSRAPALPLRRKVAGRLFSYGVTGLLNAFSQTWWDCHGAAHEEACKYEHVISDQVEELLANALLTLVLTGIRFTANLQRPNPDRL